MQCMTATPIWIVLPAVAIAVIAIVLAICGRLRCKPTEDEHSKTEYTGRLK